MSHGTIEVIDITDDSECDDDVMVVSAQGDSGRSYDFKNNDESSIVIQDEPAPVVVDDKSRKDEETNFVEESFEDYDYTLKLMRYGNFESYRTTTGTKLSVALKDLIVELAKSGKSLILTKGDEMEPLPLDATPQALNLDVGTILNAIVVNRQQSTSKISSGTAKQAHNPNLITLKLQDGQMRHLKEYQTGKNEPLRLLKERYAIDFKIDPTRMKLCFDGDPIDEEGTAEDHDIEDECVIDVVVD